MKKQAVVDRSKAKTLKEAAETIGIGKRTLTRWKQWGCPGKRGDYSIPRIIAWAKRGVWKHGTFLGGR